MPITVIPRGGSSGGNATVPNNAPILPPQAFVDAMPRFYGYYNNADLSNLGITHIDATTSVVYDGTSANLLYAARDSWGDVGTPITFAGNALPASDINDILAAVVAFRSDWSVPAWKLDLSGPLMAAPTGQGLTDKATLEGAGWTVPTS